MLVAVGILAVVDVSGADLPEGSYPALALAVLGLGLLAGAWFGRARGIIWIGVILSLVTAVAAVTSPVLDRNRQDGAVHLRISPTSVAELPVGGDYGAGSVAYDLSAVDFTGANASIAASMGFGEIVVTVPADVDVTVHARCGVGGVHLFDGDTGGLGTDRHVTDLGADGAGGGQLTLDLNTGFGNLEVRRAQA
jgi:hypothetical protein